MTDDDIADLTPLELARFTINKYGPNSNKPSVRLATALIELEVKLDKLRANFPQTAERIADWLEWEYRQVLRPVNDGDRLFGGAYTVHEIETVAQQIREGAWKEVRLR